MQKKLDVRLIEIVLHNWHAYLKFAKIHVKKESLVEKMLTVEFLIHCLSEL